MKLTEVSTNSQDIFPFLCTPGGQEEGVVGLLAPYWHVEEGG